MPGTDVVTTPPGCDLVSATAGPEIARLAVAAVAYADAAQAPATRRAYQSDWRDFCTWCEAHQQQPLPASAGAIALYLTDRAAICGVSTLQRRLAAIRWFHLANDHPSPESADLAKIWAGIKRTNGRPPRQKTALLTEDLKKLTRRLPDNPSGVRDRALILVTFASAMRRSEIAPVELDNGTGNRGAVRLIFVPQGFEIHIDRSKADQEGKGAVIGVPYGKALCPVAALQAWLELAGIRSGPIFRPIHRGGRIEPRAMSDRAVADAIKRACRRAKINPDLIGGHSLRAGFVTQALLNGAPIPSIMQQTRHAKTDTLQQYVRIADRFQKNAAGKLGL